ncbi:hypothetical protein AB0G05_01470 [Nonomuraea wenchangensis]
MIRSTILVNPAERMGRVTEAAGVPFLLDVLRGPRGAGFEREDLRRLPGVRVHDEGARQRGERDPVLCDERCEDLGKQRGCER